MTAEANGGPKLLIFSGRIVDKREGMFWEVIFAVQFGPPIRAFINTVLPRITVHRRKLQLETTKLCATSPCTSPTTTAITFVFAPCAATPPCPSWCGEFFESLPGICLPTTPRKTIR